MTRTDPAWPALPFEAWRDTRETLHRWLQIVGKARMALHPKLNHWWHVTLYVTPRGLTTGSIPVDRRLLAIDLDLIDHDLQVATSDGGRRRFGLEGLSVAGFHAALLDALRALGTEPEIVSVPYEIGGPPFAQDEVHAAYDRDAIERYHRILVGVAGAFEEFRGWFAGKSTPVHLFWHSFDLALTRFSGRLAPPMEGGTSSDREAYSHEVISFGFWPGDENVPEPAFYSYTWPAPEGLTDEPLRPDSARWGEMHGSPMALVAYDAVRSAEEPRDAILSFLESAYRAGATRGGWDEASFRPQVPFGPPGRAPTG